MEFDLLKYLNVTIKDPPKYIDRTNTERGCKVLRLSNQMSHQRDHKVLSLRQKVVKTERQLNKSDIMKQVLHQEDHAVKDVTLKASERNPEISTQQNLHKIRASTCPGREGQTELAESLVTLDPNGHLKGQTNCKPPWHPSYLKSFLGNAVAEIDHSLKPPPGYGGCIHVIHPMVQREKVKVVQGLPAVPVDLRVPEDRVFYGSEKVQELLQNDSLVPVPEPRLKWKSQNVESKEFHDVFIPTTIPQPRQPKVKVTGSSEKNGEESASNVGQLDVQNANHSTAHCVPQIIKADADRKVECAQTERIEYPNVLKQQSAQDVHDVHSTSGEKTKMEKTGNNKTMDRRGRVDSKRCGLNSNNMKSVMTAESNNQELNSGLQQDLNDSLLLNSDAIDPLEVNRLLILRKQLDREERRQEDIRTWSKELKLQAIRDADEVALARRRREQRIAEFQREEALHQDRRRLAKENRQKFLAEAYKKSREHCIQVHNQHAQQSDAMELEIANAASDQQAADNVFRDVLSKRYTAALSTLHGPIGRRHRNMIKQRKPRPF